MNVNSSLLNEDNEEEPSAMYSPEIEITLDQLREINQGTVGSSPSETELPGHTSVSKIQECEETEITDVTEDEENQVVHEALESGCNDATEISAVKDEKNELKQKQLRAELEGLQEIPINRSAVLVRRSTMVHSAMMVSLLHRVS